MYRILGLSAAVLGLIAFLPPSHGFTMVQSNGAAASSQARVADPDDLMQNMEDEQSSGSVSLPGGGHLRFNGGSSYGGGANSPFLQEPGSQYVPSQR